MAGAVGSATLCNMALRARRLVALAALAAASGVACDEDCGSLDDCDREECQVIRGARLTGAEPAGLIPVGCAPADRPAGDLETYARAPDGTCWWFPTTLIPDDFIYDQRCRQ